MNSPRRRVVCSVLSIFGTLGLVAMSDPAAAATTDAPQASVSYADLDLSSDTGRSQLEHRIATAATKVCQTGMPGVESIDQHCRATAIAQAKQDAGLASDTRNG